MTSPARLAALIVESTFRDCSPAAIRLARRTILAALELMLAGAAGPAARVAREVIRAEGGTPLCTVFGTSLRTNPTWAAFANGVAGGAGALDETEQAAAEVSVPLLAAGLACAEADLADGATLVAAYVVGLEVAATRGQRATSMGTALGAAAAAARISSLDADQARHALGHAASLAPAVTERCGSRATAYDAGHAARNGVLAVRLAREALSTTLEMERFTAALSASASIEQALDELGGSARTSATRRGERGHGDDAREDAAVRARFLDRARPIVGRAEAEALVEQIEHLEDVPDVRVLTSLLAGSLDS